MKNKKDLIAALDIGTSKVACFIAEVDADGEIEILGIGHQVSIGARSGVITDIHAAKNSIVNAVHTAEHMAGERIDEVMVNISGGQIRSHRVHFSLNLSGQAVSQREVNRLMDYARSSMHTPEREVIHCIPINYSIDEARGINEPTGMYGNTLGTDVHIITAPTTMLRNITQCVAQAQLDVGEFLVSSYASGLACLTEDEMQLGVIMVDIGGGTTSVAVFVDGKPFFIDHLPVGGNHITNDIALGLSTGLASAERIKALYGSVYASLSDSHQMIEVPNVGGVDSDSEETHQVSRSTLSGIIRPRMEEILEMVRARLEDQGIDKIMGRRIALAGGTSQLMGVAELASQVFNRQVRVAKPRHVRGMAESTGGAAFATGIGMLEHAARRIRAERQHSAIIRSGGHGTVARAWKWLREKVAI